MELKSIFILATFFIVIVWERFLPARNYGKMNFHDFVNIFVGIINSIIAVIFIFVFDKIINFSFNLFSFLEKGNLVRIIVIFIILDIWTYTWHRLNHNIKFLKTFHRVHHTDTRMSVSTALRFHFVEIILSRAIISIILIVLGVEIRELILYEIILNIIVYFHHSNIKINSKIDDILRKVIVTPNMHRIHHSVINEERNSNYSGVLSIWDRLFNSYTEKSKEKEVDFGVNLFKDKKWTDSFMIIILPLKEVFKQK